jgi:hypothetical protein
VLISIYVGAYAKNVEWAKVIIEQIMAEDGMVIEDEDRWFR